MRLSVLSFVTACVLVPICALADPTFECGVDATSQVEIAECVNEMLATVDQTLDSALSFAMTSAQELDDVIGRRAAVPALSASQSAWSTYRDSHCDYVGATFGGGSGTGIGIASCRVDLGRARVEELLSFVQ